MKDATTTLPLEDLQAKIKDLEDSNSVMVPQQIRNAFEGLEAHVLHNFKMAARIQDQGRRASTRIRARVVLRSSAASPSENRSGCGDAARPCPQRGYFSDESRRRRGRDVVSPWRQVATP